MVTLHNSIFNRNCCHAWDTFSTFSQSRNRKPAKSIQLASLALNWLQSVWEKTANFDWLKPNLVSVKLKKRALLVLKAAFESCSWQFCCKHDRVMQSENLRGFLQFLAAWISNILPKILRTGIRKHSTTKFWSAKKMTGSCLPLIIEEFARRNIQPLQLAPAVAPGSETLAYDVSKSTSSRRLDFLL